MTEQNRKWSESPIHDQVKRAGLDNAGEAQSLSAPSGYVSADWILDNMWNFPNETWWEAQLNGEHRQFVRIRLDIEKQEYVLDAVGIDRKYSEELWRYKGGDWQFISHNRKGES